MKTSASHINHVNDTPSIHSTRELGRIRSGTSVYRRVNLALFVAGFVTFITLYDVQPLLPVFSREYGMAPALGSLPLSISTCTLAIAMLFAGTLSETWGRKQIMTGALFVTSLLALLSAYSHTFASLLFVPYLVHQFETLAAAVPSYVLNLKGDMDEWQMRLADYYSGEEGAWLLARGKESLTSLAQDISGMGYNRLTAMLYGIFNLVLAPILVFFMLLYKQHIRDIIRRLTPLADRRQLTEMGKRINTSLERFILAMLLDCLLVSILTALALFLLGIEFPLLNGLFSGFASIVPFVGVALAVIPPTLIGYAQSGDLVVIPKKEIATVTSGDFHLTDLGNAARRMAKAFVASADLKPMTRQLLADRTPAAYSAVEDYARRKGWTVEECERWLAPVLNYDVTAARAKVA